MDRERRARAQEHARLAALPLAAQAVAGFAAFPLVIETTELRSRRRVNVVLRGSAGLDFFSPGDPVLLGPVGRPQEGIAGRVDGVDDATIELRLDDVPEGKGPWAISRRLDLSIHELQTAELERAERKSSPISNLLLGHERPYLPDPYAHPAFAALNASQRAAAELALGATEVGLIHGPPGTGKTHTLVALLSALAELGERPWALADSNAAVDHLTLQAAAAGLDVVRIGVSSRMRAAVQPLTLEWRILHGPRASVIRGLMKEAGRTSGPDGLALRDAIRDEWATAKREILTSAQVISMTLGTLHTRGASLASPRTAVVDEASQVIEPALWLLAARCKRIILAGDPAQLGPVVASRDPLLERSLLARLVDAGFPFPILLEQYRFNDEILNLANQTYGNRLRGHASVQAVQHPPATTWIDTAGMGFDEAADHAESFYNEGELGLVAHALAELFNRGFQPKQIGVIAPYRAQVERLRAKFPQVEVGTVNAFQGREKDVIVASFVRSNQEQQLGFVSDPRRLNVAITRARHALVGIGDSATLGASAHFSRLIDAISESGGYRTGWEWADQ